MVSNLDDIRARFPKFSVALYALEPGGDVTLEIFGEPPVTWSWTAPTVAAVIAKAFPEPDVIAGGVFD